jgi:hypothetical protein
MKKLNLSKRLLQSIIFGALAIVSTFESKAQRFETNNSPKLGGAIELVSPGNSHGGMIAPLLSVTKGKHSFFTSALIQKRSTEFVGGRLGYSINLSDDIIENSYYDNEISSNMGPGFPVEYAKPLFYLNAFASVQYYHQAMLSKTSVMLETRTARDNSFNNWANHRMSTAEIAIGAELNFRFTKRITWKNTIGIAVYNHLNYSVPMYASKIAPTLLLGTGIHICPL